MREDGRSEQKIRKIKITRNYIKDAEGSCFIEMGSTRVICTASFEDRVPLFLKGKGSGWITAEYGMLPRSCQRRIPREAARGKVGGRTHEIQRLIGRSLRAVTNLAELGEITLWMDCDVIQADGGTRCASITGAFIALVDALVRLKKDKVISVLPIRDFVAAVSVGLLKGKPLLDLNYQEDSNAEVDMNVIMTGRGEFVEIQGTAEQKPFTAQQMDTLVNLARKGIKDLIDVQTKAIGHKLNLTKNTCHRRAKM